MSKHTPAPWRFDKDNLNVFANGMLAQTYGHTHDGEREANARLIAAAPEMLEALQAIAKELNNDAFRLINSNRPGDQSLGNTISWVISQCELAIAKATGGAE